MSIISRRRHADPAGDATVHDAARDELKERLRRLNDNCLTGLVSGLEAMQNG